MNAARCGHTATLLRDGKVILVGGTNSKLLSSAELYDPTTGKFTSVGEMAVGREGHTATLLGNGNVLIVGGCTDGAHDAEIFDVKTQLFEPTGKMSTRRSGHTATILPDGKVLIVGGTDSFQRNRKVLASAELYNPATGKFTSTGSLSVVRYKHAALLLPDGNVLIVGGSDERDWQGQYNSAELYHAKRGVFSPLSNMQAKRFKLPADITLLDDNTGLVIGGSTKVEVFDPSMRTFTAVAEFEEPHFYQTATLLRSGEVLIAGGYNTKPQSTDMAWIFRE
jgi:hypothetical protein